MVKIGFASLLAVIWPVEDVTDLHMYLRLHFTLEPMRYEEEMDGRAQSYH